MESSPPAKRRFVVPESQQAQALFDPRILPEPPSSLSEPFQYCQTLTNLNNPTSTQIIVTLEEVTQGEIQADIARTILHSQYASMRYDQRRLWFHQAGDFEGLKAQFKTFALSLRKKEVADVSDVLKYLEQCSDTYLLIFNGAPSRKAIQEFIPKTRHHILIITCDSKQEDKASVSLCASPKPEPSLDIASIFKTFEEEHPDTLSFLAFLSLLRVKKVPVQLIDNLDEDSAPLLLQYGLIETPQEGIYSLHSCLTEKPLFQYLNEEVCEKNINILNSNWIQAPKDKTQKQCNQILLSYLKGCVEGLKEPSSKELAAILFKSCYIISEILRERRDYQESKKFIKQALKFMEQTPNMDLHTKALALNQLGKGLFLINSFEEAKEQQEAAVKCLGYEQTQEKATCLRGLGDTLCKLKDFQGARTKYLLAIGILKQLYGEKHPQVEILREIADNL